MRAVADQDGKVWIAVDEGELHATFALNADQGVPFASGQEVEIADERIALVIRQLLAPFGAQSVPVEESPQ